MIEAIVTVLLWIVILVVLAPPWFGYVIYWGTLGVIRGLEAYHQRLVEKNGDQEHGKEKSGKTE